MMSFFVSGFSKKKAAKGFTLAEILVALSIIGLIAAFTIPKFVSSTDSQKRKAVIREAYSTVSESLYTGMQDGLVSTTTFPTYFVNNLRSARFCTTNATTQGCWTAGNAMMNGAATRPALVFHNGAVLAGFTPAAFAGGIQGGQMVLDWNGIKPPNIAGEDQMLMCMTYVGNNTLTNAWGVLRPGEIIPCANNAASVTLYNNSFQ
jgi:prepilin-type N-terminal cleavage/methylation domain-containing protein